MASRNGYTIQHSRNGYRRDIHSSLRQAAFYCSRLGRDEEVYERWLESRQQSIKAISDLRKRIDDTHYGANVARATGAGMCLFGEVLKSDTRESGERNSDKPNKAGDFLETLGSIIGFGAELVEMGVMAVTMSEVKEILDSDDKNTSSLKEVIQFSSDTSVITKQIFNSNGFSNDIGNIMQVFGCIKEIISRYGSRFAEDVFETIENSSKYSEEAEILENLGHDALQTLRDIVNDPSLYKSMTIIYGSWKSSSFVRRATKQGLNMFVSGTTRQSSALQSYSGGFLKAVNLATETMELLSLVNDLQEDRKTANSEKLLDVEIALTDEMNRLTEMHRRG